MEEIAKELWLAEKTIYEYSLVIYYNPDKPWISEE